VKKQVALAIGVLLTFFTLLSLPHGLFSSKTELAQSCSYQTVAGKTVYVCCNAEGKCAIVRK
jgi:hypothetical protein